MKIQLRPLISVEGFVKVITPVKVDGIKNGRMNEKKFKMLKRIRPVIASITVFMTFEGVYILPSHNLVSRAVILTVDCLTE